MINFFSHPFFNIVGGISTLVMIAGFTWITILFFRGILPVLFRLGIGLAKRKIAVFSSDTVELKNMLIDSGLFNQKNVIHVSQNAITSAAKANILLVHWKDFNSKIDEILSIKMDNVSLIIYAPQNEGKIDDDSLNKINSHRNTIIVNFKGRLLNDILTSLITVSFERD